MSFKVEMKNIGNFILRRKWIIIAATLVAVLGVVVFNNRQQEKKVVETIEKAPTIFVSEFGIAIENEVGAPFMGITIIKSVLTSEETLKNLAKLDVLLEPAQLESSLNVFIRANKGEISYFRVVHENRDYVEKMTTYLFETVKNKQMSFFENKVVSVVQQPTAIAQELIYYSDIHTTTDSMMLKAPVSGVQVAEIQKTSPVLGGVIGIIIGLILAVVFDIFNKKIYSLSYIETVVGNDAKIVDASYNDQAAINTKLDLLMAIGNSGKTLIVSTDSNLKNSLKGTLETSEWALEQVITVTNLKESVRVIFMVKKGETELTWLKDQYMAVENSGLNLSAIFYN